MAVGVSFRSRVLAFHRGPEGQSTVHSLSATLPDRRMARGNADISRRRAKCFRVYWPCLRAARLSGTLQGQDPATSEFLRIRPAGAIRSL